MIVKFPQLETAGRGYQAEGGETRKGGEWKTPWTLALGLGVRGGGQRRLEEVALTVRTGQRPAGTDQRTEGRGVF